jgi:hypothetical protein
MLSFEKGEKKFCSTFKTSGHTFNYIIDKMVTKMNTQQAVILGILSRRNYSIQNKFEYVDECMKNVFFNEEIRLEFMNIFFKIQRIYHSLARLAYIYKYKKSAIVVDEDLCMNKLLENKKNVICIFQKNSRYLFNIRDLIKVINSSLTNSHELFSLPLNVKNPYNNIMFNKSTLYNIYFFVKFNTILYPELLFKFFEENFNLRTFGKKQEHLLREYILVNYINNTDDDTIHNEILDMINYANTFIKYPIYVDKDFPKKTLIKIMKPYFKLWISAQYSLTYSTQRLCYKKFKTNMNAFSIYNPAFGRKIIVTRGIFKNNLYSEIREYTFESRHPRCE